MRDIRILLADDHEIVRRGVRNLLESQPGWRVVAEAANGVQAVERALELKPEIVVLDLGMPDLNGFEAARRIREHLPLTEVLVLTGYDSDQMLREAQACGARGYLVKSDVGRDLIAAVKSVRRHKFFLSPQMTQDTRRENPMPGDAAPLRRLTAREREITQLLAEGKNNKEIATQLNISVKTTETHRTNIMRKIGAHSLPDLIRFAIRNRLVNA